MTKPILVYFLDAAVYNKNILCSAWRLNKLQSAIQLTSYKQTKGYPDNKIHGANLGPTWGRKDPGGPHVGLMNLAIWVSISIILVYMTLRYRKL